jgi:hypothetical protein
MATPIQRRCDSCSGNLSVPNSKVWGAHAPRVLRSALARTDEGSLAVTDEGCAPTRLNATTFLRLDTLLLVSL